MMEILRRRRSIRRYEEREIEQGKIDALKEAALRAPSSRGFNPWRFLFITERSLLAALSRAKESGSDFLKEAALGIVVCAKEDESDVWIEDCAIASIILQLCGLDMDLGSCWIQIRKRRHSSSITSEEYVRNVLGLGTDLVVECIIAFGYPAEQKPPVDFEDLEFNKILQAKDFEAT